VLIELEEVRKRYGTLEALRGLSAAIEGRIVGILGPNGAGKSTLLKVLLGLVPFEGEARVLGFDPREAPEKVRDRVGYMPESESYLARMSAVELCAFAGELSGLPRIQAMQRAHAALYYANLEDKRYLPVEGYSTGMKQKVKLAQALVHDPEILFLDEPTNGLDPAGREEMLRLIQELPEKRGCAVLLSTHLLPDVERVCDQVVVLHEGQILFAGGVAAFRGEGTGARYEVRVKDGEERLLERLRAAGCQAERGGDAIAVVLPEGAGTSVVFAAAREAGVQVRHLAPARATLESAFLRAVGGGEA
jgi:ABC-2 type transport system ATP-binding protein